MYFSALHVPARAQAFIFHNQAEVKGLEGMWVSLAEITFTVEVEQLQRCSSTEFLALFSEEFSAFHRLRLEKGLLWQLQSKVLTSTEPLF